MSANNHRYHFFSGGEMGQLIREKAWRTTPLGDPATWPSSLRTMVAVMLDNPFGMYIAWGQDYTQIYNDGYRPILGSGKHPQALGLSTRTTFSEVWHILEPMFDGVMQGKAVGFPDFMLPLNRDGFIEECYFDFSYSPIRLDDGSVGGILVTVIETTGKKKAQESVKESEARFRAMADNIPNLAWMANADGSVYWYNKQWFEYTGTTQEEMEGWGWQSVSHPDELPRVLDKWQESITTGQPFEMVFPLKGADGQFRHFLTRVQPVRDSEGKIYQWFGSNTDITFQMEAEEALKQSKQRFYDTVRQAPVGITILRGREYMVEMANDAYLHLVDRKEAEFIGGSLFDSLPEVESTVRPLLDGVLDTGIPYHGREYPIPVDRYGSFGISYFDFLYHPLKEEDGSISGIIVTVTDVSEQVSARAKVEESDLFNRTVLESSPDCVKVLDLEGRITFININGVCILEGDNKDYFIQRPWETMWGEDNRHLVTASIASAIEGKTSGFKALAATVKGTNRWWDVIVTPIMDPQQKVVSILATSRDITDERKHEQELTERELKFRLLADSMPQHIWTSDTEGNLNYFNRSVYDYSGLTPEQIAKDGWIQIVHPDDRDKNIRAWVSAIATGTDFLLEHRFRRHDGVYRWQLSRAIPQKDEGGSIQMWVGTSTDIQDQKTFATELESQVQERTRQLATSNNELEKINKELQSFAYISSHDLQEPLRKIQTFASWIRDREYSTLTDNAKNYFERINKSANRMQVLIEDLLAYSRTATTDRVFAHISLNQIVDEVKDDLKEELKAKHATIIAGDLCEADVITFQFRQLMYNLVSNSLKFTYPERPPVIKLDAEIKRGSALNNEDLTPTAAYCHITVEDNGIGFEPEYNEKIFELFQRLHGQQFKGTGLGLAIVKKIIENHQGIITATGEPGKGARFDIYLPHPDSE